MNGKSIVLRAVLIIISVFVLMTTAMPAVGAGGGACDWTGTWDTNWGKMELVQTGTRVTGTYEHDNGKIVGEESGNSLIGTWSEAPSYSPPDDAGDFEFTISPDCNSFTGKWRYGSTSGDWKVGGWTGDRVSPTLSPGFEAVFAIVSLVIAVAYLLRKKK